MRGSPLLITCSLMVHLRCMGTAEESLVENDIVIRYWVDGFFFGWMLSTHVLDFMACTDLGTVQLMNDHQQK